MPAPTPIRLNIDTCTCRCHVTIIIIIIAVRLHIIQAKITHSLRKLFTSFLGFNAFILPWLRCFFPSDIESRSFSLLGKENDLDPLLRSLSEVRGVCELYGVLLISLPKSESSLIVFLFELLTCFPALLSCPSSLSEPEDM